jgi:hypothetical protein
VIESLRGELQQRACRIVELEGKTQQFDRISEWLVENAVPGMPCGTIEDVVVGEITRLRSRVDELEGEIDDAENAEGDLREELNDVNSLLSYSAGLCVYCRQAIDIEATDHWRSCEQHPARREVEALKLQVHQLQADLTSALFRARFHCDACGTSWSCTATDRTIGCPVCTWQKLYEARQYLRSQCAVCVHNPEGWRPNDPSCCCSCDKACGRDDYPLASGCDGFRAVGDVVSAMSDICNRWGGSYGDGSGD